MEYRPHPHVSRPSRGGILAAFFLLVTDRLRLGAGGALDRPEAPGSLDELAVPQEVGVLAGFSQEDRYDNSPFRLELVATCLLQLAACRSEIQWFWYLYRFPACGLPNRNVFT